MYKGFHVGVIIVECMALYVYFSSRSTCRLYHDEPNRWIIVAKECHAHLHESAIFFIFIYVFCSFILFVAGSFLSITSTFAYSIQSLLMPTDILSVLFCIFIMYLISLLQYCSWAWFSGVNIIHSRTKDEPINIL